MKLQNLIIVFIIIIIPIIFMFSYYLSLQIDTMKIQTDYDEKLIEAAKESMEAYEINTLELNSDYSSLSNVKRRNINSAINVFTESLASKMGIGGTAKDYILKYIPAIVYIMYDGYYIYTPTYIANTITNDEGVQLFYYKDETYANKISAEPTRQIDGATVTGEIMYEPKEGGQTVNGITFTTDLNNAKRSYKHVLKTFVPYSNIINDGDGEEVVINYTLDNYIRVIWDTNIREGYVEDRNYINNLWQKIRNRYKARNSKREYCNKRFTKG